MGLLTACQQLALASAILSTASTVKATSSVTLPGYGSFIGTSINQTLTKKALPAPVDTWLGIDYASQPIGDSRFAPVGPPAAFPGTRNATQYGLSCIQDPADHSYEQSEACLSMNVFRPQHVSSDDKVPVLIWIHGGGFVSGSARSFDGPSFVANSKEPLIVVNFNYRINSLGFLPHPSFERLGLLNLGLRDQELLFEFVQKYISKFGGDPDRVTIGGRSAGAHSVGIHLFHNYNKTEGASPLFSQALLQSGSVTARSFPNASYPLYNQQFSRYLEATGCSHVANDTDAAILSCLRAAPIESIQQISSILFQESEYAITWPFQPTRGGPLLELAGSQAGVNQQFYKIPTITTNVLDEAKYYSPGDLETNAEFLAYLKNLIPRLSSADLSDLETLYPDPTRDPASSQYAHSPNSTQYNRISAALTDYMYVCPGQETALRMSAAGAPVYKLRFATNNTFPAWQGVPHTADTKYTWAEPSGSGGVQYPDVGGLLHGYFVDFVVHGDPSKGKKEGVAKWLRYEEDDGVPGLQLRVEAFGNSRVEGDGERRVQCEWWRDGERAGRLEK